MADDLAAFGAPVEMVQAARAGEDASLFEVWEDNAEALLMFMRLQTQWVIANARAVGLNYQSAAFLIKIHCIENPAAMMDDLQAMELAALQVLNAPKE